MSAAPRFGRIAAPGGTVAWVVALLALAALSGGPAPAASGPTVASAPAPCSGSTLPHNYTGTLVENGTSAVASVALDYSYYSLQENVEPNGSIGGWDCEEVTGSFAVAPGAPLSFSIDPEPIENCTPTPNLGDVCERTSGPYGAINLSIASPIPNGDFAAISWNGTAFQVGVYPYLASIALTPGPSLASFGPGTTDEIHAEPRTGAGNATPFAPSLSWSLAGEGWSFVGAPDGASVNVTAAAGADDANLTVAAAVGIGGTTFDLVASEALLEVPTAFSSANLARTSVDVAQPVAAWANGTAAAGGTYSATLRPGLDDPPAPVPCSWVAGLVGTVDFSCTATLAYTEAGIAQPILSVSDGASATAWTFPDVTVHPDPEVAFDPALPVGYVGAPVPISVVAGAGTGVAPYALACLAPGVGPSLCSASGGPSWAFRPTYPAPGNYSAIASVLDGAGTNRSATTTVRVVAPLGLAWATVPANASVGTPVTFAARVAGGDLPARIWWNVSGASNPVATAVVASDGIVDLTFDPSAAGFATVSVAVVDGLGSEVTASTTLGVVVGAPAAVVATGLPPSTPVRAGAPFGVAWQVRNAEGEPVDDFTASATIALSLAGTAGAVPGTVNASGIGPLPSPLPGWFDVPAAAWIGGTLNVSVSVDRAGAIDVRLVVANGTASSAAPIPVTVLPDTARLVLSDPEPGFASARAGATRWRVTDRFGDPATGASLYVTSAWDGTSSVAVVPVVAGPNGSTEAWVNYSIPGGWAGTVRVTDAAGAPLLPTISVAGLAGPLGALPMLPLLVALAVGAAGGTAVFARRRARRGGPAPVDDEAELQRLAEGRAAVVEIVRRAGPIDLAGVATLWDPPPAPPDLADWLASLLTDGSLDAECGPDGVARFVLPAAARPVPTVTVDVSAFDRAEARRAALAAERDADDDP